MLWKICDLYGFPQKIVIQKNAHKSQYRTLPVLKSILIARLKKSLQGNVPHFLNRLEPSNVEAFENDLFLLLILINLRHFRYSEKNNFALKNQFEVQRFYKKIIQCCFLCNLRKYNFFKNQVVFADIKKSLLSNDSDKTACWIPLIFGDNVA